MSPVLTSPGLMGGVLMGGVLMGASLMSGHDYSPISISAGRTMVETVNTYEV